MGKPSANWRINVIGFKAALTRRDRFSEVGEDVADAADSGPGGTPTHCR
jgi:hypothetical protein